MGGRNIFYSSMPRSQSFSELHALTVKFTSISAYISALRWERMGKVKEVEYFPSPKMSEALIIPC